MQSDNEIQQAIRKHASKRQTETRKHTTIKQRVTNEHKRARSVSGGWQRTNAVQGKTMQRKTRLTLTETNKTFLHRNKESGLWAFPKRKRIFPLKMIYCMFLHFLSLNLWIKIVRLSLWNLQPAFYPVAALAVCTFHQSWELAFFSKKLSQFTKEMIQ